MDTSILVFMVAVLVVLVVRDFRVPLLLWLKHKLPREYELMREMLVDFAAAFQYLQHWGQVPPEGVPEDTP